MNMRSRCTAIWNAINRASLKLIFWLKLNVAQWKNFLRSSASTRREITREQLLNHLAEVLLAQSVAEHMTISRRKLKKSATGISKTTGPPAISEKTICETTPG